jgi:hypothetical protein
MSVFRTCPTSLPGISRMEFSYFHSGTETEFEEYFEFVRRVAMEDFELCEKAQQNLEKGVYFEGILNPNKEQGVSFYQSRTRELVHEQRKVEAEAQRRTVEGLKVDTIGNMETVVTLENNSHSSGIKALQVAVGV